ncbi:hypothetical protein ABZS71_06770 [Streptomyces sp. NPDC005393]|uniref:hypothetical protein n=1 Tax=Streptomyces sp. NPDC005393 TaxID=3157041 RepID=UPI00339FF51D
MRDAATGRVGVLMDVTGFVDGSRAYHLPRVTVRLAFLRPLNGGGEWTTAPGNILSPTESWGDE